MNCPSVVAWRRCDGNEFYTFGAAAENARKPVLETMRCSAKRFSEEECRELGGTYRYRMSDMNMYDGDW